MRIPPSARVAATAAALLITAAACSTGYSGGGYSTGSTNGYSAGSANGAPPPAGAAATTVAAQQEPLGTILVDGSGRTVYLFAKDTSATSTCIGGCVSAWPPVMAGGAPHAGNGASTALIGTTPRPDRATQLTYAGHPLYYYAGDTATGDTNGQGLDQFGAGWYVLAPDGNKIAQSSR